MFFERNNFHSYFLVFSSETTQLEDPRQEWRAIQEAMLREYLQTAQDVLEVSSYKINICTKKINKK